MQAWDQVCAFQGDNTVQLQDALRAGSLPGLQRAVPSLVTQRTQARLMQKYKDMLAVDRLVRAGRSQLGQAAQSAEWSGYLSLIHI